MTKGRVAAASGLVFVACYIVHRLLQGLGPADASAAAVSAYVHDRHAALLLSEVANGLGLIAFIVFLGALHAVLRDTTVLAGGIVFVTLAFVSNAAETALFQVADDGNPAGVVVLNQLQALVPIVWAIAVFVGAVSWALLHARIVGRWVGVVGSIAAVVFLIGSILSTLSPTPEGASSLFGVVVFVVWMILLCAALWRLPPTGVPGGAATGQA